MAPSMMFRVFLLRLGLPSRIATIGVGDFLGLSLYSHRGTGTATATQVGVLLSLPPTYERLRTLKQQLARHYPS